MKRILSVLAAAVVLFTACDSNKTKTIRVADFVATYPASLEILHSSDGFPNDAALYFKGENGQLGFNTVVYYSDAEIEYLEERFEEQDGLEGFIYSKVMELFDKVDRGLIVPDLQIEDVSDLDISDDGLCQSVLFSGISGEEEEPWIGGITIYFNNGALVTSLAIAASAEDMDELLAIGTGLEFDAHEGSYQPDREELITDDEGEEEE